MKRFINVSLSGFLALLLVATTVWAQDLNRYNRGYYPDYDALDLSREQMDKIAELEQVYERGLEPILEKLSGLYREMDNLQMRRNPDRDQIDKVWDQIDDLEKQIARRQEDYMSRFLLVLTPEQQRIYNSGSTGAYYGRGQGQAYLGRGLGQGYGRGMGRGLGRFRGGQTGFGLGYSNRGYYGVGVGRGYGLGYGRGAGGYGWGRYAAPDTRYSVYPRYGRGPFGAGLGRWDRRGAGRGWWRP